MRNRFERVDPKRIDFHGLPRARRDDPIADLGIHPGELHTGAAGEEETVRGVHVNAVARALHVGVNHSGKNRKEFL